MKNPECFAFLGGDNRTPYARAYLSGCGYSVTEEWETAGNLVLPCPVFDGRHIRGGPEFGAVIEALEPSVSVYGGRAEELAREVVQRGGRYTDYSEDQTYLYNNAAITAEGAAALAMDALPRCIRGARCLVIGFGRIGKLLCRELHSLGAQVTASARKEADLGLIRSLGYGAEKTGQFGDLQQFHVIFNTVPAPVLSTDRAARTDAIFIELASAPGGILVPPGRTIIRAGGLPGRYAPEDAGVCLAQAVLRLHERSRNET